MPFILAQHEICLQLMRSFIRYGTTAYRYALTTARSIHVVSLGRDTPYGLRPSTVRCSINKLRGFHETVPHSGDGSTIYALSTPPGRSAIAVIRVSGQGCLDIYRGLCPGKADPIARQATLRKLYSPAVPSTDGVVTPGEDAIVASRSITLLDAGALVLYFPAPKTVTGEDVLELHVHGGPAIVRAVLRAIAQCQLQHGHARFAEPGEFTKRAFWNNKLDLTQIEALGDMLTATTEQQRKLSVRGASETLAKEYDAWRMQLLHARGELEALIDFSEDQHFDESTSDLLTSVAAQVTTLTKILRIHVRNAMRGELLRNGISLSLLGAPNAGKSSLLNRIVGREAAIVSHEAGTTRDVVEVGVDIGGYFCRFGDTAGLRSLDLAGHVEQEGIRRARSRAANSDVVIIVLSFGVDDKASAVLELDAEVLKTVVQLHEDDADRVVIVLNKIDLVDQSDTIEQARSYLMKMIPTLGAKNIFAVSSTEDATTSTSVQELLVGLTSHFDRMTVALSSGDADQSIWQLSLGATERHRRLIEDCIAALDRFSSLANTVETEETDVVIAAEHLRDAADALAKISGRGESGDVEEVLGVVFEKFCVGK